MRKQLPGLLLVLSLIVAVCNESKVKADFNTLPDETKQAAEESKESGQAVASAVDAKNEKTRPELAMADTIVVLTSCDVGQISFEDAALGHGVFIHFLLEGLQGKAVDDHRELTLLDLFKYVGDYTTKYVAKRFGALQRPRLTGSVASSTRLLPPRKSPDSRGPQSGHRALLIGVDKYAMLNDARFPVADAEALAATLIKSGFPEQQVSLVCDTAADRDHLPSRANILRSLRPPQMPPDPVI